MPQTINIDKNGNFNLTLQDFSGGVNSSRDSLTTPTNQAYFALNTDSQFERDVVTRSGYVLAGTTGSSGKPWLLGVINQDSAPDILVRIINAATGVQLQKFVSGSWTNIGSAFGTNSDRVPFSSTNVNIGGVSYMYFCNGVSTLRRTEGSTNVAITNSGTNILCKYITNVQNILVAGNFTATYTNNTVLWSEPGTDTFYRTGEAYSTSSNIASFEGPISQIICPALWNNLVYCFTQSDGIKYVDVFKGTTGNVSDLSCVSPRSIVFGDSAIFWFEPNGRVYMYTGAGTPVRISRKVERIIQSISVGNIPTINAGIINGNLRIWIGSVTSVYGVSGENYSNVELEYDINRSRERGDHVWKIRDNIPAYQYVTYTSYSGFQKQYIASNATETVFARDTGLNDNGSAISTVYRTGDILLTNIKQKATPRQLYIKYVPQGVGEYLIINFALDGNTTYTTWISSSSAHKCSLSNAITNRFVEKLVNFPQNKTCKSISIEFRLSSVAAKMQILDARVIGKISTDDIPISTL